MKNVKVEMTAIEIIEGIVEDCSVSVDGKMVFKNTEVSRFEKLMFENALKALGIEWDYETEGIYTTNLESVQYNELCEAHVKSVWEKLQTK